MTIKFLKIRTNLQCLMPDSPKFNLEQKYWDSCDSLSKLKKGDKDNNCSKKKTETRLQFRLKTDL